MDYTQYFRSLRETRGFTHETLAAKAGCHRNTVINVEGKRPVKIQTIVLLMQAMGYDLDSREVKQLAVLWLQSSSGILLDEDEFEKEWVLLRKRYRESVAEAGRKLNATIARENLNSEDIHLLRFAASRPEVREILEQIRTLTERKAGWDEEKLRRRMPEENDLSADTLEERSFH